MIPLAFLQAVDFLLQCPEAKQDEFLAFVHELRVKVTKLDRGDWAEDPNKLISHETLKHVINEDNYSHKAQALAANLLTGRSAVVESDILKRTIRLEHRVYNVKTFIPCPCTPYEPGVLLSRSAKPRSQAYWQKKADCLFADGWGRVFLVDNLLVVPAKMFFYWRDIEVLLPRKRKQWAAIIRPAPPMGSTTVVYIPRAWLRKEDHKAGFQRSKEKEKTE